MIDLVIDTEFKSLIPSLTNEEFGGLEASILEEGRARVPLNVWSGILLDGHNRFTICKCHNLPFTTQEVGSPDWTRTDAMIWIIQNQFNRRNLSSYARTELAMKLHPLWAEKARANNAAAGTAHVGNQHTRKVEPHQISDKVPNASTPELSIVVSPANREPEAIETASAQTPMRPFSPPPKLKPVIEPVNTLKKVAEAAGVSHDTMHKAEVIAEKASEDVKAKLRAGQTTINREYKAIVGAERKAEQVEAVKQSTLPAGKYVVIVSDPPWSYGARAEDVTHRAANPYPSMSIEEICAMPVESIAADNAILWLWTTNAHMYEAYAVAKAWGFTVKTILTWAKDRMGTGDWLRGQTEHCLMCIRGKPVVTLTNQTTLLNGPLRQHSRKPDAFYTMVDNLCPAPAGGKVEMFCRQARPGWIAAGAEISKFEAVA